MEEPSILIIVQQWEGYVVSLEQETFWAVLTPIVGEGPEVNAEIKNEEVEPDSRDWIEPGQVFYWTIGYATEEDKKIEKGTSVIRFLKPEPFTQEEIEAACKEAERLGQLFKDWETNDKA